MFKPEGVYFAMVTPFKDGKINEKVVRQIVEFDIQNGVDGLFPVSTCGEFIHMDFNEKVRLIEIVHDQAKGRAKVAPGIGTTNPRDSIALAKEAERIGCDLVVLTAPYYFPISQGMLEEHAKRVAASVKIPVSLYNIPSMTTGFSTEIVANLSKIENIVSIKDSSGSMVSALNYMSAIEDAGTSKKFNFLTGREDCLLPMLVMGAKGCFTGCSGIVPEIMVKIYEDFNNGNLKEAKDLQYQVVQLLNAMFEVPFPYGLKLAMEIRGFSMGEPVQPLSQQDEKRLPQQREKIEMLLRKMLGENFKVNVEALL